MTDAANWISAFVALAAFVTSIVAYRSADKSRAKSEEMARRNADLLLGQAKLEHQAWADEYFREITQWACSCSTAIATAIHVIDKDDNDRRLNALITLSACIDMGRWYFPNRYHDVPFDASKELAYRGVRQPILEFLVRAYDVLDGRLGSDNPRSELVTCQRRFVSEVQQRLDPRAREKVIGHILLEYEDVDKLKKLMSPI